MGQNIWGYCCAFAIAASFTPNPPVQGDEPKPAESLPALEATTLRAPGDAQRRIENTLDKPLRVPLEFIDAPLNQIAEVLQEDFDIPIQFDRPALDAIATSPEVEVTIQVAGVSLRSALNLMLRDAGGEELTYVIDNEVLLITTEEEAEKRLETRIYRVDDIDVHPEPASPGAAPPAAGSCLVEILTSCIKPESWQKTGQGQMRRLRPGVLVVYQTRRVHQELERAIDSLRQVTAAVNAGSAHKQSVAAGENPFKTSEERASGTVRDMN
jgi:hypothetical protein